MLNRLFSSFIRPVSSDNVAGTAKEQKDRTREQSHGHKKSLSEEKLFCEPNVTIMLMDEYQ